MLLQVERSVLTWLSPPNQLIQRGNTKHHIHVSIVLGSRDNDGNLDDNDDTNNLDQNDDKMTKSTDTEETQDITNMYRVFFLTGAPLKS